MLTDPKALSKAIDALKDTPPHRAICDAITLAFDDIVGGCNNIAYAVHMGNYPSARDQLGVAVKKESSILERMRKDEKSQSEVTVERQAKRVELLKRLAEVMKAH